MPAKRPTWLPSSAGDTVPIASTAALRLSVTKRLSGLVKAAAEMPSTVLQKQGALRPWLLYACATDSDHMRHLHCVRVARSRKAALR